MIVKRSLILSKGEFRKTKTLMEVDKIKDAPVKIVATCVLHNICIIADDGDIDDFMDDGSNDDDDDDDDDGRAPPCRDADNKRNGIMINLP